ncbi:MAG: four helix bundle protein [Magnetococcus sp. WYHC-3]
MNRGYKDFIVWKKAMELVVEIYKITDKFPKSELFGLTSQMRRCAVSIPSNIAEGSRRKNKKDTLHFYIIAFGSGSELETQIELAKLLDFCGSAVFSKADDLLGEIMKMLNKITSTY